MAVVHIPGLHLTPYISRKHHERVTLPQ